MIRTKSILASAALAAALASAGCGDDEKSKATCDLAAPDCDTNYICLSDGEGGGICEEVCDPAVADACADGQVCNAVQDDAFGCFDPVYVEGQVVDSGTGDGIAGAQVMAADASGQVVTSVALTAADGTYRLLVPVTRDREGNLINSNFTLRVTAADYQTFPSGSRTAIPVATSAATFDDTETEFTITNATTTVGLIELTVTGLPSISGTVGGDAPGGALVVAECAAPPCPYSYADADGAYTIFNVADGAYTVAAYKSELDVAAEAVTVAGADVTGVDLAAATAGLYTVNGSINPVEGAGASSVVLIPRATFDAVPITLADGVTVLNELVIRGAVAPGLRAPEPGIAPNITNAYSIMGVPAGEYAVLAGFENDFVCRDPDFSQGGTELVFITLPDDIVGGGSVLDVGQSFKVNPALGIVSPGATEPEAVSIASAITFTWENDPGEDHYELFLIDALGNLVWSDTAPANTTSAMYDGPALELGMYYQWKVVSIATGGEPIAVSEDLRGVFYGAP